MLIAFILLVISLWLVYLEFFLPGGIMGTAGAVGFLGSLVVAAQEAPNLAVLFLFFIVAATGLLLTFRTALARVRKGKQENSVYLSGDQEGYRAPKFDESLVGQKGKAACDLRPSGYILLNGVRHQAVSRSGFVKEGQEIEVVGGEAGHLIVKLINRG